MVINDIRVEKTTAAVLFFLLRLGNLVILILKFSIECQPFKHQPHKMVKHTQTIRRQFECV